jgi:hypothetical protein
MAGNPCIQCRVSADTKARLGVLARQHQVTESALLQRLVEMALLQTTGLTDKEAVEPVVQVARDARLYVRLRPDDHVQPRVPVWLVERIHVGKPLKRRRTQHDFEELLDERGLSDLLTLGQCVGQRLHRRSHTTLNE